LQIKRLPEVKCAFQINSSDWYFPLRFFFLFVTLFLIAAWISADAPEDTSEIKHDRSPLLRQMRPAPKDAGVKRVINHPPIEEQYDQNAPLAGSVDPVLQTWFGQLAIPSTNASFEGMSCPGTIPPDTNGEAGHNQFVQTVNKQFAVFDKSGTILLGPLPISTLWQGFGGACETGQQIDPLVIYDQLHHTHRMRCCIYIR
jgi:hypothetical protein